MTTPRNGFVSRSERITAPISPSQAINQGDLLKVSGGLALPVTANTDTFIGTSDDTNPVASLGDQLSKVSVIRAAVGNIVFLILKASDVVNFNDLVYLSGIDAQTVTSSSAGGATAVGRVRELASFTGDGASFIRVELGAA